MNKEDIKKALIQCSDFKYCDDCPYFNQENKRCRTKLQCDALILITEQEKEIERLKAEQEKRLTCDFVKTAQKQAKIEAVKEFAEKLKEKALLHCRTINCYECKFIETTIDELLEVEE